MSRPEAILNDIQKLNTQYWSQIGPLERKLAELESAYQATQRQPAPAADVIGRGLPMVYVSQLNDLAAKINALYAEWEQRLTYINPPAPSPKPSGSISSKIPWPSAVPQGVRKRLGRIIDQGGLPLSKRVQIVPAKAPYSGAPGVAVEFAKW